MLAFKTCTLLATAALLAAGCIWIPSEAHAGSPSFNCARADSRAEELICGDQELALMDVEATRLFRLARDGKGTTAEQKKTLNSERARWLKMRDECWFSEDMRLCIISAYAVRIHSLREKHQAILAHDDKGITRGPVAMRCDKLGNSVKATFISSDPPISALQLPERVHVGIGAGNRYVERNETGELAFWTQGNDAFLKMPDGARINCKVAKAK